MTVLDRGYPLDEWDYAPLLLHEMIHAMQHGDARDSAPDASDFDGWLAARAMSEGEAVLYQDIATTTGLGWETGDVSWSKVFDGYRRSSWQDAVTSTSPYELSWYQFPYAFGGAEINRAWRRGGTRAARQLVDHPPSGTREIMFGLDRATAAPASYRDEPLDVGMPVLPARFQAVHHEILGAWSFEVFRQYWAASGLSWDEVPDEGYAGDVLSVFRETGTGQAIAVWRVRMDSAAEAQLLSASIAEDTSRRVIQLDRDFAVIAAVAVPTELMGTLQWTAVPTSSANADTPAATPWPCRR